MSHQRREIVALKIEINKETKADRESVRLTKSELQNVHRENFDYNVTKTVEKTK